MSWLEMHRQHNDNNNTNDPPTSNQYGILVHRISFVICRLSPELGQMNLARILMRKKTGNTMMFHVFQIPQIERGSSRLNRIVLISSRWDSC